MWKPTSLRQRLAVWVGLSTAVSLTVFAGVSFYVVLLEDTKPDEDGEPADSFEEAFGDVERQVLTAMAFAAPVGLGLAIGGAYWVTRRMIKPIDSVISAARAITPSDLSVRLPVPPVADELQALVIAMNDSFARLENGFAALSRFTGHASHELRTPIATLRSELEVGLRRQRTAEEWEVIARSSLEEVTRLTALVDGLLRYTRAEASLPGSLGSTELAELLAEVIASSRPKEGGPEIVLEIPHELEQHGVWVDGDRDALSSVFSNLLRNAQWFAGARGKIAIKIVGSPPGRVTIHVDDNGPGIAVDERALIFEPFTRGSVERASRGVAQAPEGVGLGLSIARQIVRAAGGEIQASDSPLGGARLSVELRLSSRA